MIASSNGLFPRAFEGSCKECKERQGAAAFGAYPHPPQSCPRDELAEICRADRDDDIRSLPRHRLLRCHRAACVEARPRLSVAAIAGGMLEPFRIANGYGLFAEMTHARYEIEFQGPPTARRGLPIPSATSRRIRRKRPESTRPISRASSGICGSRRSVRGSSTIRPVDRRAPPAESTRRARAFRAQSISVFAAARKCAP